MPAVSREQRQAMAIAEHEPEKLYKKNRGLLKMSKEQLHDYTNTTDEEIRKQKQNTIRRKLKRGG